MPRLGGPVDNDEDSSSRQRREATAYANDRGRRSLLLWVCALFIMGRILFHDYRRDVQSELLSSGLSQTEVDRHIPPTSQERKSQASNLKTDLAKMKSDIAYLMTQVDKLNEKLNQTNSVAGGGA